MIKIGDVVKIKSPLKDDYLFGVTRGMKEFEGFDVVVTDIGFNEYGEYYVLCTGDEELDDEINDYYWSEKMIEKIEDDEEDERMNSGVLDLLNLLGIGIDYELFGEDEELECTGCANDSITMESFEDDEYNAVLIITIGETTTLAILDSNPLSPEFIGVAKKHPMDEYTKKIGVALAYTRAKGLRTSDDKKI